MKMLFAPVVALLFATPAFAQDEAAPASPVTVSGTIALVSDYRFRGVSQSDKGFAVQGGITATHTSGVYGGFWSSNLAGWGTFGGPNLELDLFGGYKFPLGSGTLDIGATWYMYPGGANKTDFVEPYARLGGTIGPVSLLAGVAYAPAQQALGNWSNTPQSRIGDTEDNLYLWGDVSTGVPGTAVTVKAHVGYSDGNPGLGPNGTSVAPTGRYADWSLGADYLLGPVTLGVSYVGTDISRSASAYLLPNFSSTKDGSSIAAGKVMFLVSASF